MKKIEEYFQHAAECRGMARTASAAAHRQELAQMADAWERLAVLSGELNAGADRAGYESPTRH